MTNQTHFDFVFVIDSKDIAAVSPNGRCNPFKKARIVKKLRAMGKTGALKQLKDKGFTPQGEIMWTGVRVRRIMRRFQSNHFPDADNTQAAMKSVIDGICDHLQINDRSLTPRPVEFEADPLEPRWVITFYYEILSHDEDT